jgi:hypothetical protein
LQRLLIIKNLGLGSNTHFQKETLAYSPVKEKEKPIEEFLSL